MKTLNKCCGLCLLALLLIAFSPAKALAQPGAPVSYQTFYDELQPYGTWVDDPDYGSVWVPNAEEGFRPYATDGHWVLTDYGNTWVSDYDWGWAAFHYGRWRFDDYYGWEWLPGTDWAPAWVAWRRANGYYAWAPLGFNDSLDGSFANNYYLPDDYWVCAPYAYINSPYVYNYYLPQIRVGFIIRRSFVINNTYSGNGMRYVAGPRPDEIQRFSRAPVQVYHINNVTNVTNIHTTIINNNTVNIYRPNVVPPNTGAERPRPATVVDAAAYRNAHPDAGIASRSAGATINHDNAARLAQTASNPQNNNMVHVNRPMPNAQPNGYNPIGNTGLNRNGNRPVAQPNTSGVSNNNPSGNATHSATSQPNATAVPNNAPATTAPANSNTRGGFNRNGNQPNNTSVQPQQQADQQKLQQQADQQRLQQQQAAQRQAAQQANQQRQQQPQPQQRPQAQPQQTQTQQQPRPQVQQPQQQPRPQPQQQKPQPKPQPRPQQVQPPPPNKDQHPPAQQQ